jgi:glycosyltransferase involved in cell wall biosynthesis
MPSDVASSSKVIVHVAETEISEASGMGRVAWHWRRAFLERGHEFVHIGPAEMPARYSPSLFPLLARRHFDRLRVPHPILLLHEPVGGMFVGRGDPVIVFSHGLERRAAILAGPEAVRWRRVLTAPLWWLRAWSTDRGLRRAAGVLAINREDAAFLRSHYRVPVERMFVFRNGVHPVPDASLPAEEQCRTILFLGSWLRRKGIDTLAEAASRLHGRVPGLRWVLGGTGAAAEEVLRAWPRELHGDTEIVAKFPPHEEAALIQRCGLFVLPSRFEGQPLSLLQAMAAARCCLASAACGQLDLIQHGVNGLLHQPGNAAQLAEQIAQCVSHSPLAAALGMAARDSVRDRSWSGVSEEVVSFVEAKAEGAFKE